MKKYSVMFLALMLFLLLPGCAGEVGTISASPGQEFSLAIGQSATISGEDLEVKFEEVLEDSRCPTGVMCIWAGRVSCAIRLTDKESSYRMVLTEPGLTDQSGKEIYKNYQLSFHVQPYPEAGKRISNEDYRLLLSISKSQ